MSGDVQVTGNSRKVRNVKVPDGGWGWMVVFGSFMIHVITDGVTYSFGVFYDEFLTYFKEGKGPTAWILSILVGVTLCSGPISSIMVSRYGCRTVTIIGSILASVSMVVSIFAKNVKHLYFSIGLGAGFGFGLIYLPAIVSVSNYFENKRSLATGIAVCGSGFGTFIFAPIITKLLEIFEWKTAMLIIAGIVLTCVIFGSLFKPLKVEKEFDSEQLYPLKFGEAKLNLDITSSVGNLFLEPSKFKTSTGLARAWSLGHLSKNIANYGSMDRDKPNILVSTKSDGATCNYYTPYEEIIYSRNHLSIPQYNTRVKESWAKKQLRKLNFSLFKESAFILFVISNFLTSIGFNIPYVYIISRAKSLNISNDEAGIILSVIGIANTLGRIILGYISDKPWVNRFYVYNVCLTICGFSTILSCFCLNFATLVIYGSVFGFTIGAYVGLTSVILVDLLGLDRLTNAFGILLLFQGVASLIGPPIAGELYDSLKSYDPGFYVAGIAIGLSGLILFFIPCIQRCK